MKTITFALFFANRGFFPGEAIAGAMEDMKKAVTDAGCSYICMPADKTRYGAVETIAEGKMFAAFLEQNRGKFDGVIVCLPNFGDENGAYVALKDAGVPLLIHAYPDEIGKMDFAHRRDSMCGKFAICNVLRQADIKYSLTEKFVTHPLSADFSKDLARFAAICRIVRGLKKFNIGAIGARTTAFKTVRADESAFMKNGINIETIDLSEVFSRMKRVTPESRELSKAKILTTAVFEGWGEEKLDRMAELQSVLEDIIAEYDLQAVALRCWNEFETEIGIAPCANLGVLGECGVPAACEVDITNAVMMRALALASEGASTLLDYNNNYGEEADKCIMFHCGPVPVSLMEGKGRIEEHLMFKKSYGAGSGVGVNRGVMKSGKITFGSVKTEDGRLCAFVTEAEFTDDAIEREFFGTGKVVKKSNINDVANYMAENGYKHHVAVGYGEYADAVYEAMSKYLGYGAVKFE